VVITGTVPVPEAVTFLVGFTGSLLVMVSVVLRGPVAEGENVTVHVPVPLFGGMLVSAGGVIVKSPAFPPEAATLLILRVCPVSVLVLVITRLSWREAPTTVSRNDNVAGAEITGAKPVPRMSKLYGFSSASLLATLMVAVLRPLDVGEKLI
jgi:hypothetical protein